MDELMFSRRARVAAIVLGASLPALGSCSLSAPAYDEYARLRPAGGSASTTSGTGPIVDGGATTSGSGNGGTEGVGDAGRSNEAGAAGSESEAGSSGTGGATGGSTTGGAGNPPGGGGSTAGVSGSGAGGSAGGSNCETSGSELCDDFELGRVDDAIWKTSTQVATLEVDKTRAHRGSYSAHIRLTPGQRNVALLEETVTFPAPANTFYARAFVFFSPALPGGAGANYQTAFILAKGKNGSGDVEAGVGFAGGDQQFLGYTIFVGPPFFQFGPRSAARVNAGAWLCLELMEDGSNSDTERRKVWVDGDEIQDLSTDSAQAAGAEPNHRPPAFERVSVGVNEFFATPTLAEMWVDDVRVSRQRIGCDD